MKKSMIFVGILAIGYANAQIGRVGINTNTPTATLEVSPRAANALATATTNEGILAPRLSKARIANIATPVEGTLVYATNATYTGNNAKVSKITEKGYYYYNGTEWVKTSAGAEDTSIYTADGTLSGDRTVNMNGKNLLFTGTSENAGRLGIGTINPNAALSIEGTGGPNDDIIIKSFSNTLPSSASTIFLDRYRGTSSAATTVQVGDDLGGIVTRGYTSSGNLVDGVMIVSKVREATANSLKSDFLIGNVNNVGIGIDNPTEKLDVAGSIKSTALAGTGNRNVMANADGKLVIGEATGNTLVPANLNTHDVMVGQITTQRIECNQTRYNHLYLYPDGTNAVCAPNNRGAWTWKVSSNGLAEYDPITRNLDPIYLDINNTGATSRGTWAIRIR